MPRTSDQRDPLIALRIPPALDARLRAEAADTGSTISEIVRSAIEHHLPQATPPTHPAKPLAARTRKRDATCAHRVRPGNYCRRCDAVI